MCLECCAVKMLLVSRGITIFSAGEIHVCRRLPPLAPAFSAHDNDGAFFFFSCINMYDVVRVAVLAAAPFLTGSLPLPGGLLLFIGQGNNAASAYFGGFELPSTLPPPFHRLHVSTPLISAGDSMDKPWRLHPTNDGSLPPPDGGLSQSGSQVLSKMWRSKGDWITAEQSEKSNTTAHLWGEHF